MILLLLLMISNDIIINNINNVCNIINVILIM